MARVIELEAARGWNCLSLAGRGCPEPARQTHRKISDPAAIRRPKPARELLLSNPEMSRRLAEHSFAPWWLR